MDVQEIKTSSKKVATDSDDGAARPQYEFTIERELPTTVEEYVEWLGEEVAFDLIERQAVVRIQAAMRGRIELRDKFGGFVYSDDDVVAIGMEYKPGDKAERMSADTIALKRENEKNQKQLSVLREQAQGDDKLAEALANAGISLEDLG